MRRTVKNHGAKFVARCGHLVGRDYDYIEVTISGAPGPLETRWCSPACADRATGEPEVAHTLCRWRGCLEEGTLRDIAVTLPAPKLGGGAILATFSDDVPLCDAHAAELEAKMIEVLTDELTDEEEQGGEDSNG